MDKIVPKALATYVLKFTELVAPQMLCIVTSGSEEAELNEPEYLSVEDMLALWMQLPDCSYTPMFCGWMLAQGVKLEQYSPADMGKAVCIALTGSEKNIMFDYIGDTDGRRKPN